MIQNRSSSANSNGQAKTPRSAKAVDFLRRRFGEAPGQLYVLIWTKRDESKRSHWLRVDRLNEAESFLAPLCKADAGDVYAGVALSPEDFGRNKRCDANKAAGIAGLWADLDVKGEAHKKGRLPKTLEQAQELARSLGVEPTEEIFSGHGLQAWWLFNEPWIFRDDNERQHAADLVRRFQAMLQAKAEESGWDIDRTHDLARILRLPGTWNHKVGDAVRVRVLGKDGPRYEPGDFLALVPPEDLSPDNGITTADTTTVVRAQRYVARMPAAVSGQGGHQATWAVAQVLLRGFALSPDEARPLMQEYNARCVPSWSAKELEHKIHSADEKSRLPHGYLLNGDGSKGDTAALSAADAQNGSRAGPYMDNGFIYHLKILKDGAVPVALCNFSARIVQDVVHDDGAEQMRRLVLEGKLAGGPALPRAEVPATEFAGMNWVVPAWGTRAVVNAGMGTKDHLRAALQLLSGDVPRRTVFAHLGWRIIDGAWHYLHSGGAIGPDGLAAGVEVSLPGPLAGFDLPAPPEGEQLAAAVRASLSMLDGLAPDRIVFPVLAAIYRAVLGDVDFSEHLAGPTGVFKTELAALAQQHWGKGLDSRHLPGSWSSTGNSLEGIAFAAKDALLIVDDFAPGGSVHDVQRYHREADRVFRAQGNRSGRGRMRPDGTLRPAKPPRGMILSTGEDVPRGQSLRARLLVIEVSPGEVNVERLSDCQQDAVAGLYAQALAGFIRWLASRYEKVRGRLHDEMAGLRGAARAEGQHARTPGITADLALSLRYFLRFARAVGVISRDQRDKLWERGQNALAEAAAAQAAHITAVEPAGQFIRLLSAALASGRAHVADASGREPQEPAAWGWRGKDSYTGRGPDDTREQTSWTPQGRKVGWLDGADLYLEPEASFAAAQELARDQGEALPVTPRTLHRRLKERGLLASWNKRRQRNTVRRTLEGVKDREVLHLRADSLGGAQRPSEPSAGARKR
jgi:hypothetical protein